MRPRKVILLVDANERQAGMTRLVLDVAGYRVRVAHDPGAALVALALPGVDVDLVLGYADGMLAEWPWLAAAMKQRLSPGVEILLVGSLLDAEDLGAANVCYQPRVPMAQLLERIRLMITRKRGPRKMLPVLVPAVAGD